MPSSWWDNVGEGKKKRNVIPKATLWRAIKAKCSECRAFYRIDCESVACPLYMFLKQRKLQPSMWWLEYSAKEWSTLPSSVIVSTRPDALLKCLSVTDAIQVRPIGSRLS